MRVVRNFPTVDQNVGWYHLSPYKDQVQGEPVCRDEIFDIAIVGAGFSGVAVAQRLSELHPDLSIGIFEALKVGQGASGRNTGYIVDVPLLSAGDFNIAREGQLYALNRFAISRLEAAVCEHKLEVDWTVTGKYAAAHDPKFVQSLDEYASRLDALGITQRYISASDLAENLGTSFYKAAVYTDNMVVVNPASLIMGLAKSLPNNVRIFEDSPVRSVQMSGDKSLIFEKGTVRAGTLVFAGNAFNEALGASQSRLAPMITYSSLTRVLTNEELEGFSKVAPYAVRSVAQAGTTLRFTPDNRINVRNSVRAALTDSASSFRRAVRQHRKSFLSRFPKLSNVPFEYSWGGQICITLNGDPQFSEVEKECYAIGGYNGAGIAKGTYLGHYLAERICGVQSPELEFIEQQSNPSLVPPEPFRRLGAAVIASREQKRAAGEV